MEIIGIVIGFSTVMLLLSLIVTSLGQATKSVLRLGARNLKYGLSSVLGPDSGVTDAKSKQVAAEILNHPKVATFRSVKDPDSLMARILGPKVTWLSPDVLKDILEEKKSQATTPAATKNSPVFANQDIDKVVNDFENVYDSLWNRFEMILRGVSFFWALVVAVVFQVSTPLLIEQLSTDPVLRAQYNEAANAALELGEEQIAASENYDDVYEHGVTTLAERYPDLQSKFLSLDTSVDEPEGLAEEFAEIIEDRSNRSAMVTEFNELVVAGLVQQRDDAIKNARTAAADFSAINITPFRYGAEFYSFTKDGLARPVLVRATMANSSRCPPRRNDKNHENAGGDRSGNDCSDTTTQPSSQQT